MPIVSHQLRRDVAQLAIRSAVAATSRLSIDSQRRTVRSLLAFAGEIPAMRQRVRENMSLALGPGLPAHAERLYFRHLGWFLASLLATFHRGFEATPVPGEIGFDESIRILDDAVAEGRGAVITSPHWSGHELVAAQVNRRHPMTRLVRQASTDDRMARKLKWYNALGAEIVLRPRQASMVKDAVAYSNVLKRGRVLAITADLLAGAPQGIETQIRRII